jgi:hypothetical protein
MQRRFPAALPRPAPLPRMSAARPSVRTSGSEMALGGRVNQLRTFRRTDAGNDGGDSGKEEPVLPRAGREYSRGLTVFRASTTALLLGADDHCLGVAVAACAGRSVDVHGGSAGAIGASHDLASVARSLRRIADNPEACAGSLGAWRSSGAGGASRANRPRGAGRTSRTGRSLIALVSLGTAGDRDESGNGDAGDYDAHSFPLLRRAARPLPATILAADYDHHDRLAVKRRAGAHLHERIGRPPTRGR